MAGAKARQPAWEGVVASLAQEVENAAPPQWRGEGLNGARIPQPSPLQPNKHQPAGERRAAACPQRHVDGAPAVGGQGHHRQSEEPPLPAAPRMESSAQGSWGYALRR
jgi:hypothetical protein